MDSEAGVVSRDEVDMSRGPAAKGEQRCCDGSVSRAVVMLSSFIRGAKMRESKTNRDVVRRHVDH